MQRLSVLAKMMMGVVILFPIADLTIRADDGATLSKLHQIPPPDGYRPSDDGTPHMPVVVVTSRGVSINQGNVIPFDQVLDALARLPRNAWKHGRVILYYPFPPGISRPSDQPSWLQTHNVEEKLQSAGVKLVSGASA